jgi:hypothetical protein
MRDDLSTFSNKQSLSIPAGTNLNDTNSTSTVSPQSYGAYNIFLRVKNTHPTNNMAGTFIARLQYSVDGGTNWETNDEVEISIPAASLAVGRSVIRRRTVRIDFRNDLNVRPGDIRLRLVYSTTGRVTGDAGTTLQVTAYLHPALAAGAYN